MTKYVLFYLSMAKISPRSFGRERWFTTCMYITFHATEMHGVVPAWMLLVNRWYSWLGRIIVWCAADSNDKDSVLSLAAVLESAQTRKV